MSQAKTTRAFRTISEAGDELGLQPHVLRFWESKFSQIKPIKRGGGRRFYRPEDIEFIRGIKKLLHDEKHSIKDVQKLINKKGANRVVDLGRSVEKAKIEKPVADTDLLPERIKSVDPTPRMRMPVLRPRKSASSEKAVTAKEVPAENPQSIEEPQSAPEEKPVASVVKSAPTPITSSPPPVQTAPPKPQGLSQADRLALEDALRGLESLKSRLVKFRQGSADA